MQVSPLQVIPVTYSVLPTDATLYYIQAVLRDSTSNKILQTINLTQDASYAYRYTGRFNSVSDPSGLGRQIDITVLVYTDSGHTTLSQNYAALQLNYTVLQPWIPTLGAGGGGSIDYKKLRKEISDLIDKKTKPFPKIPDPEPVAYERIESAIRQASDAAVRALSSGNGESSKALIAALEGQFGATKTDVMERVGGASSYAASRFDEIGKKVENVGSSQKSFEKNVGKELAKVLVKEFGDQFVRFMGSTLGDILGEVRKENEASRKELVASIQKELGAIGKKMGEKNIDSFFDAARKGAKTFNDSAPTEAPQGYTPDDAMRLLNV